MLSTSHLHRLLQSFWLPSAGTGATRPTTRDRDEIPERFKWNLADIYPDVTVWERDLERMKELVAAYGQLKGTLAAGPDKMLEAMLRMDQLYILVYRVYQYPSLMSNEDTRNNQVQARFQRARNVLAELRKTTSWFRPELLQIPAETMWQWFDQTPELAPYRFPVEEVYRRQQHVLDEAGEQLLAYASRFNSSPDQIYSMLADADVEYETVTLASGAEVVASYANLINVINTNRNQDDREAVFKAYAGVFSRNLNTYAAIYGSLLQRDWYLTQSRHYPSTIEAALDENNIPVSVVEGLIATSRANVAPLQRYHRLRKATLGLERYRYFDAYLPLVDIDWTVPYDSVKELVVRSVEVFGPSYQQTVVRAFDERWVDVYENEGKRTGAFSAGVYGVHPFMLLNYGDTLSDAFAVAHEMGHTMHTMLSYEKQPFATCSYTIFVAEVASMTNEDLLLDQLLACETDPGRRITLLQHAIDDIAASFYRQAMFAEFELRAHRAVEQDEPITAAGLQELYLQILRDYFGDSLDDQEWYRSTWAQVPHFYSSPYYVYQYATAKAAASLIHQRLTDDNPAVRAEAVQRYLTLLSAGGNDHPVEQLKKAGVDFTTSEPIEALVTTMGGLVSQLEEELARSRPGE